MRSVPTGWGDGVGYWLPRINLDADPRLDSRSRWLVVDQVSIRYFKLGNDGCC